MESLAVRLFKTREEILDPTKWGQGFSVRRPGTMCLAQAAHKHNCESEVQQLIPEHLHMTQWNDAPERTHKEVIELLNKAISKELGI